MIGTSVRGIAYAALLSTLPALASHAEAYSKNKSIIVVEPADLPEAARAPGLALFLQATTDGNFYLYEEQENGTQLTIYDVTDPGHIKVKSTKRLNVQGAYDFVRPIDEKSELIRFRGSKKAALLVFSQDDVHLQEASSFDDPKQAVVTEKAAAIEPSGASEPGPAVVKDFDVVDTTAEASPEHVATVFQVEHQVANDELGTTFLLNRQGLTVVRRPKVEEEYSIHKQQMNN